MKTRPFRTINLFVSIFILTLILIALFILAFLYIDFSGHKSFVYRVTYDGGYYGLVKIDKYNTEDKIIFKSAAVYPYSSGYPYKNERLSLDKNTLMPLKYTLNMTGRKGLDESVYLTQNAYTTNMLFTKYPSFTALRSFETGDNTTVFSHESPLLYMSLMAQYNFWRKGPQYFEIMVPVNGIIPLLRDNAEVKYIDDDYVSIMGKKSDAEIFTLASKGIPEARITLSKYGHNLMRLEIPSKKLKFEMTKPEMFTRELKNKSITIGTEIFIDSGTSLLQGELVIPKGEGPFPALILIPEDGPMTNGEYFLFNSLMKRLSESGTAVLSFNNPGQGKSYGAYTDINDSEKIANINRAVDFLGKNTMIDNQKIVLAGYKQGAYLAVKASATNDKISSVIALGIPDYALNQSVTNKILREKIDKIMFKEGLGMFDASYMETITAVTEKEILAVKNSQDQFMYYMGKKLPLKSYKEYLDRPCYDTILAAQKPVLLLFASDDIDFKAETIESIKVMSLDKKNVKLVIARGFGEYMGTMVKTDNIWQFVINGDILQLIKNWLENKQ